MRWNALVKSLFRNTGFFFAQEALRHQREKWQTWDNFALVSVQTGHYSQAVEAVSHVLRMGKRFDVVTIKRVIDVVESQMRSDSEESEESATETISQREATRLRNNLEELFKKVGVRARELALIAY